jgi:hypothetical protein
MRVSQPPDLTARTVVRSWALKLSVLTVERRKWSEWEDSILRPLAPNKGVCRYLLICLAPFCRDCFIFSEALAFEGPLLFTKACEMGRYELVSKTLSSLYSSGKGSNRLKVSNLDVRRGAALPHSEARFRVFHDRDTRRL